MMAKGCWRWRWRPQKNHGCSDVGHGDSWLKSRPDEMEENYLLWGAAEGGDDTC